MRVISNLQTAVGRNKILVKVRERFVPCVRNKNYFVCHARRLDYTEYSENRTFCISYRLYEKKTISCKLHRFYLSFCFLYDFCSKIF